MLQTSSVHTTNIKHVTTHNTPNTYHNHTIMQEHNPNATSVHCTTNSGQTPAQRSPRTGSGDGGGRFKLPTTAAAGPTTMIINLGEPRTPTSGVCGNNMIISTQSQQHVGNMRTIITTGDSSTGHGNHGGHHNSVVNVTNTNMHINNNNHDLLSLLAPISTVMSTSGVILATANNSTIDQMPSYHQTQNQTQQHQSHHHHNQQHHQHQHQQHLHINHQQQHHQQQQHHILTEISAASANFAAMDTATQHIVHHLNESGAIIATTTTLHNNNGNTNNMTSITANNNGRVHQLGADIQLFEIPMRNSDSNDSDSLNSTGPNAVVMPPTTIETVHLTQTPTTDGQIVYVTSADAMPNQTLNHNNNAMVTKNPGEVPAGPSDARQSHEAHGRQLSNQEQQLEMSALTMTNEQAESLMNEAVEQKDEHSQLNLLAMGDDTAGATRSGSGDQSSFSSPGSMEIDLDATLDDDEREGELNLMFCVII